jgi:two-component system, OmpR family, KDP operon response regulator KdpE
MIESHSETKPLALIIEDNDSVAEICRIALERAQFEVELAQDGRTALERLTTITPALIILDLHLPHVSGNQILHQIRSNDRLAGTRVILTTADLPRAESLQNEVDFVLVKPFGFIKLYELAKELHSSNTAD